MHTWTEPSSASVRNGRRTAVCKTRRENQPARSVSRRAQQRSIVLCSCRGAGRGSAARSDDKRCERSSGGGVRMVETPTNAAGMAPASAAARIVSRAPNDDSGLSTQPLPQVVSTRPATSGARPCSSAQQPWPTSSRATCPPRLTQRTARGPPISVVSNRARRNHPPRRVHIPLIGLPSVADVVNLRLRTTLGSTENFRSLAAAPRMHRANQ